MDRSYGTGRLFWKLLMALLTSMVFSTVGAIGLLYWAGDPPPPLPPHGDLGGLAPLVPLISGGVAMLVTSMGFAWYLSRPLHHLRWALNRIEEGHLDTRVRIRMGTRRDEIVDLAQDFDRMAAELQKLTESRKLLLHDISHELRSPLARLQVAIGLVRQDPSQLSLMLDRIERESERLDVLIEELLTLHRLEAGALALPLQRVDIIELLRAIAEDAQFEAVAMGKDVSIDMAGEFTAVVQGELVCRAYENVIRNAVKFSPVGGHVDVKAWTDEDGEVLMCTVSDQGLGVPENMLEAIFHPFTRAPGADAVPGTGLGLAIAKRALALHGGDIKAFSCQGGGLTVQMKLPKASPVSTHINPQGAPSTSGANAM